MERFGNMTFARLILMLCAISLVLTMGHGGRAIVLILGLALFSWALVILTMPISVPVICAGFLFVLARGIYVGRFKGAGSIGLPKSAPPKD